MDWKAIIKDLRGVGLSVETIAGEVGLSASAVREIVAGRTSEPRYAAGDRLVALHKTKVNRPAPTRDAA